MWVLSAFPLTDESPASPPPPHNSSQITGLLGCLWADIAEMAAADHRKGGQFILCRVSVSVITFTACRMKLAWAHQGIVNVSVHLCSSVSTVLLPVMKITTSETGYCLTADLCLAKGGGGGRVGVQLGGRGGGDEGVEWLG